MTDVPAGYEIAGTRTHNTHSSPGGCPGRAAQSRGSRTIPVLILKPPSSPLRWAFTVRLAKLWQAQPGFAESLDPVFKRRSEGGTC